MSIRSTVGKRLFFGSLMTIGLTGLILGEGWLAQHNYFFLPAQARGVGFALLAVGFALGGCVELWRMAQAQSLKPPLAVMLVGVVVVVLEPIWSNWCANAYGSVLLAGSLLAVLMLGAAVQGSQRSSDKTLASLAIVCLSTVYLGLGCWFVVAVRLLGKDSPATWGQVGPVLMFLACVKACDIGAYFTGRFLGRHKLAPQISPGKTWEGCAGGVVLSLIVASLFAGISGIISNVMAIVFGAVISVTGQLGDLLESMLKRDAGSKDSGRLVPEFGGVLDVLDSVLVSGPFAYLIFCCAFDKWAF